MSMISPRPTSLAEKAEIRKMEVINAKGNMLSLGVNKHC